MPREPLIKRTFVFVDGQNLYHSVKEAFGYTYPNYDPLSLARAVSGRMDWELAHVYFYTGVPLKKYDPIWHHFWERKIVDMGKRGIRTFTRSLRYSIEKADSPDGSEATVFAGREKGIDVRIALDVVKMARRNLFDVALIFSQDQDLSEVANEVREISSEQNRWIKIACAFPSSPSFTNTRGINGTDWIRIDKKTYDACLDPVDYRISKK